VRTPFSDVFPNDEFRPYTVYVFQRGHRLLVTSFSTRFTSAQGRRVAAVVAPADLGSTTPGAKSGERAACGVCDTHEHAALEPAQDGADPGGGLAAASRYRPRP
jgi:hypothetical protein